MTDTSLAASAPVDVVSGATQAGRAALRQAFSLFPSGVTALCALGVDGPVGMAASSFTSVSLDPPMVSVCVDRASTTWPVLAALPRLGISVLGSDHVQVCRDLAAREGDRFAAASWQSRASGAVFLDGAALWLDCTVADVLPAGDHEIVLLEVGTADPFHGVTPLIFHLSQLKTLG